jgi:hypothetical protein
MSAIDMQRLIHNEMCAVRSWTFVTRFDQWRLNSRIEHHRHLQKNPQCRWREKRFTRATALRRDRFFGRF